VECGLPVPRETLRLVGDVQAPRLVTSRSGVDQTARMQTWVGQRLDRFDGQDLCGFIFKKDSPSSGLMRVKVYNEKGMPEKKGVGIFARAFTERFPRVPVEEDGRLHDPLLRENFIERIFTLQRWRRVLAAGPTLGALVEFHTRHKLLLMAHSPSHYQALGRLVAAGRQEAPAVLLDGYEQGLLEALALKPTVKKHVNVLQHMLGYFKKALSADEKQEMLTLIDHYHQGLVPLVVPLTLINHYTRKYRQAYLADQVYLNPHPVELKLRNHA
jgi:uncharacterized protein YbgA (DUF1722 family)